MNRVKIKTDIVYNSNAKKDIIITHISDIHFSISFNNKKFDKIIASITKLNPDYIMITGDVIDDPSITKHTTKIKELVSFISELGKISKVLISIGNHDILTEKDIKFFNKLNDLYNIYILNNSSYQDEFIYVSGFTLPNKYYYNISKRESLEVLLEFFEHEKEIINNLPTKLPKIAMIHSPVRIVEKEPLTILKEYDIILSGHTHNGMVPDILDKLFKANRGIISPTKNLFPEVAKGKLVKEVNNKEITIIISGGCTKLSLRSAKALHKLDFVYNISVNKIIIRKKRGNIYE